VCSTCGAFWGNRSIDPGEREQGLLISATGSAGFGVSGGALSQLRSAGTLSFIANFASIGLNRLAYRVNGQALPDGWLTGQLTGHGGLPIGHELSFSLSYTLDNLPELASQPFMPTVSSEGFGFSGQVGRVQVGNSLLPGGFYDPEVATGYEYRATSSLTTFDKVMVPQVHGDGVYELQLWSEEAQAFEHARDFQAGQWIDLNDEAALLGLGNGPVSRFLVQGIEVAASLDPTNPNAFVTGLTFEGTAADFSMTPHTTLVPDGPVSSVPEPGMATLAGLGIAWGVGWCLRRRNASPVRA
jgi:hypothetical protein